MAARWLVPWRSPVPPEPNYSMVSDDGPPEYPPREPRIVAAVITLGWMAVVAVIVAAAGGSEPTIAAGSVVTALALAAFGVNVVAGALGRPADWARGFAVTFGLMLGAAVTVSVAVRWSWDELIFVPMVALVSGSICWLLAMLGQLAGGVVRVALGRDDDDQGIL